MKTDGRIVWVALLAGWAWGLYANLGDGMLALLFVGCVVVLIIRAVWVISGAFVRHMFRPPDD